MTAQTGEKVFYNGEEYFMANEPLTPILMEKSIKFFFQSTNCYRGYYGTWEIDGDKLYLIGIKGIIHGQGEVGLDFLFPGQEKVFADWVTEQIRLPKGKILEYVHSGYSSVFEEDIFLDFENGILIQEKTVSNVDNTSQPDIV
jgi:hypothetical protein